MASGFGMLLVYVGVLALRAHPEWLEASPLLAAPAATEWASVPAGVYAPLFPATEDETKIPVRPFLIAKRPVTNGEFLSFVRRNPEWRRDRVSRLRADDRYLVSWTGALELAPGTSQRPVVNVSWFSARAYCQSIGARLPTEAEWEYVASASETSADGRRDPAWSAKILRWYASPSGGPAGPVGRGAANFWGVHDLHGSVWEWVSDFDNSFVVADSRRASSDANDAAFCGGGAIRSSRPEDYASFMRVAYRSSLQAKFVGNHLGFRCARDASRQDAGS